MIKSHFLQFLVKFTAIMSYAELCLYGTYTFPHQISCLSRDFAITLIIGEKNKRKVYNSAF